MKNLLFFLIALFLLTEGLIFFHYSRFEKTEYDSICHGLYDEKVWIDKCYLPYGFEIKTFETARNLEIIGIVGGLLFYLKKFYLKN